jgi:hypothetical protein
MAHPLGPIIYRFSPVNRTAGRRRAIMVAAACAALLAIAMWLEPNPRGLGTHTQLGMYRCTWPMVMGIPCPTCGMTTAFAWMVRGRPVAAFSAQPLGALLALVAGCVMILAVREACTLRSWRINWYRVRPRWYGLAAIALALAAWSYKILAFRAAMG